MQPSPPTDRCSALIETKTSLIYFGATPHTTSDFESVIQWTGEQGLILDLRVDTERQKKTATDFQYHDRMEVTDKNYIHFPITDRSVPIQSKRTMFQEMLRRALRTLYRWSWVLGCSGGVYADAPWKHSVHVSLDCP